MFKPHPKSLSIGVGLEITLLWTILSRKWSNLSPSPWEKGWDEV